MLRSGRADKINKIKGKAYFGIMILTVRGRRLLSLNHDRVLGHVHPKTAAEG